MYWQVISGIEMTVTSRHNKLTLNCYSHLINPSYHIPFHVIYQEVRYISNNV